MISIQLRTTLPTAEEVLRRVTDATRASLEGYARELEDEIKAAWTGWKYEGRPKSAPRGTSQAAWSVVVQDDLRVQITNEARDYRYDRAYAKYIHRAGRPASERAGDELLDNLRPAMVRRVQDAMVSALREALRADSPRELR